MPCSCPPHLSRPDFVFGSESAPPFRLSELPNTRAMSKNAVSFFLREVIHGAEVGTVRAHDIRGVSTSVAFHRNWSVSAMLDAATWSSSSVFTSFYLRDLQYEFQGLRSLGPFVAAGSRIV